MSVALTWGKKGSKRKRPVVANAFETAPSAVRAAQQPARTTPASAAAAGGVDGSEGSDEEREARAQLLLAQGNELAEAGSFSQAVRVWRLGLAFCTSDVTRAVLNEQLAQVLLELDQPFAALTAAEEAVRQRPDWRAGLLTLARAQRTWGEPNMALATMRRAREAGSDVEEHEAVDEELRELEALCGGLGAIPALRVVATTRVRDANTGFTAVRTGGMDFEAAQLELVDS